MGSEYILGVTLIRFLLEVGKFPNTVLSGLMQWALHTVETWCSETGLSVNPNKTELVFTRKRKLSAFFGHISFVVTLHHYKSVIYLVVVLESRLTWKEHVQTKVKKAQNL
jgi:hypothetical protein